MEDVQPSQAKFLLRTNMTNMRVESDIFVGVGLPVNNYLFFPCRRKFELVNGNLWLVCLCIYSGCSYGPSSSFS